MKRNKAFKFLMVALLAVGAFILFSPYIGITDLVYPVHIDSVYVKMRQQQYMKEPDFDKVKAVESFYYLPSQLGLSYSDIKINSPDGLSLRAWFIPSREKNAATLIILHDINESRINCLQDARQFNDRGFNVCLMELRGHGESTDKFLLGDKEDKDLRILLDTLSGKVQNRNFSVLGKGLGGNIVLKAAAQDSRIATVIVQSVFNNLGEYVKEYSYLKWGALSTPLFPLMKRNLVKLLQVNPDTVNYTAVAKRVFQPCYFIAGTLDKRVLANTSYQVYSQCVSTRKEFWLVDGAAHTTIEETAGEDYYNKISVFIVRSTPKSARRSRFKKLVDIASPEGGRKL